MSEVGVKVRCQRCGDQMDLRDPPPGTPWQPNQFWVCQKCGRHYWTTYPTQPGAAPVAAAGAATAAAAPKAPAPAPKPPVTAAAPKPAPPTPAAAASLPPASPAPKPAATE